MLKSEHFARNAHAGRRIAIHRGVHTVTVFYQEVPVQMFALRMLTLGTLLAMYRVSPVIGIAALSIGAGYIVGQRVRRPATVNR